jgi:hypothetical protein
VFLCRDEFEAGFFVRMNNTGGPVDGWVVADIDEQQLITTGSGFSYPSGPDPAQPGHSYRAVTARACALPAAGTTRTSSGRKSREPGKRAGAAGLFPGSAPHAAAPAARCRSPQFRLVSSEARGPVCAASMSMAWSRRPVLVPGRWLRGTDWSSPRSADARKGSVPGP